MGYLRRPSSLVFLSVAAAFLAGCCCNKSCPADAGKKAVVAQKRRQSEFDFYCAMRPPSRHDTVADKAPLAYTSVVFDKMKAQGYKVYLVHYGTHAVAPATAAPRIKPAGYGFRDFFGPAVSVEAEALAVAYDSGYGMRDFFGDKAPSSGASPASRTS